VIQIADFPIPDVQLEQLPPGCLQTLCYECGEAVADCACSCGCEGNCICPTLRLLILGDQEFEIVDHGMWLSSQEHNACFYLSCEQGQQAYAAQLKALIVPLANQISRKHTHNMDKPRTYNGSVHADANVAEAFARLVGPLNIVTIIAWDNVTLAKYPSQHDGPETWILHSKNHYCSLQRW
jgi:hypothetical protein